MYRVWFSSVDGVVLCLDISTGVRNYSIANHINIPLRIYFRIFLEL